MLSKKMINLVRKDYPETAAVSPVKNDPRGPSIYISDIDLGLAETDVDQEFTAEVKIIPRRISISSDGDGKTRSYDIEIRGIDIQGA